MSKYTFYEDPGHGWLRVPITRLVAAGVDELITSCSYYDRMHYAYLEEDCDLVTFAIAEIYGYKPKDWKDAHSKLNKEEFKRWWDENVEVNDRATVRGAPEIFVRRLPSYHAHWREAA